MSIRICRKAREGGGGRVWRKILEKITHNFGYKLISLLIAIVVWYIAVQYSDPQQTKSFNVRVTVENESYIENGKQVYYIDDDYKTVTVYVSANSSKFKYINENTISVKADLTQIVDFEKDPVMVPLSVSCAGVAQTDLSLSRQTIPITIENVASKELPMTVSTKETTPANNYEVGKLTPSVDRIVVTGPESVISQIDSVIAEIDVTGLNMNTELTATLKFIDKSQNVMSEDKINDDITIEGVVKKVTVAVELWRKRSGVLFDIHYSGEPAEGYQVYNIYTAPDELTVAGDNAALDTLAANGNKIMIPAEKIDISGCSTDQTFEVDFSDVMPENLKVSSSMNGTVTVYFTILPVDSREYEVDVDDIVTSNLASSLTVSYDQTAVTVKVKGVSSNLDALDESSIILVADFADMTVGDYTIMPSVSLPEGYQLVDSVVLNVHIKEKAEKESSLSSDEKTTTP